MNSPPLFHARKIQCPEPHRNPLSLAAFASIGVVSIVSIVSSDPFPAWAASKGPTGATGFEAGKGDDPDGEGRNNHYEFTFDGNPLSGRTDGKIVGKIGAAFSDAAGDQLSALIDGIFYRIEGDVDLGIFASTLSEVGPGTELTAIQTGLPTLSSGWTYRTFSAPGIVPTVSKTFLRAKISETP